MNEELEIWKPITGYPNYEVSNLGKVKNIKTNKFLKHYLSASGYFKCTLVDNNNKNKTFLIHRLVAITFILNLENKPTVNHIDRNRLNNNLSNLEWATYKEQNIHKGKPKNIQCNTINVERICKNTNKILQKYNSLKDAAYWVINNNLSFVKNNNYKSIMSKISAVSNNKINCNTSFGFKWRYTNNINNINNNFNDEIWKKIPDEIIEKNNILISNKGKIRYNYIVKHIFTIINGYNVISINSKHYYIHRLVALTFLDNQDNKKIVNHIDGNKLNNNIENLEWVTSLENNLHAINTGLIKRCKKVIQYDKNMNKLNEFKSIKEASNCLSIGKHCIFGSCSGKYKTNKSEYIFRYADE
jgi:hypothetical protein